MGRLIDRVAKSGRRAPLAGWRTSSGPMAGRPIPCPPRTPSRAGRYPAPQHAESRRQIPRAGRIAAELSCSVSNIGVVTCRTQLFNAASITPTLRHAHGAGLQGAHARTDPLHHVAKRPRAAPRQKRCQLGSKICGRKPSPASHRAAPRRPGSSRAPVQHPLVRSSTAPVPPGTAQWHSSTATAARRRGRHATALPVSLLPPQPLQRLVVHFWGVEPKTPLQ